MLVTCHKNNFIKIVFSNNIFVFQLGLQKCLNGILDIICIKKVFELYLKILLINIAYTIPRHDISTKLIAQVQ